MTSSLKLITAIVLLIHGGGLFILMIQKNFIPIAQKTHKVTVHTVTFKPQETTHVAKASPPPKPKPKPKKVVKKVAKKPAVDHTQAKKLQKAKEALAQYKKSSVKSTARIERLEYSKTESDYADSLTRALKSLLTLPEFGEVKIAITLDRSGRVTELKILEAESTKNRKLVMRKLKEAKFSSFGSHFSGEDEHTFAIVLKNDF